MPKKLSKFAVALSVGTAGLISLSACDSTKKALGLKRNPPNEFKVIERPGLETPDEFKLDAPRPGAKRPQVIREASAREQARSLISGDSSVKKDLSDSENTFLKNAGANQAQSSIREKVDFEAYTAEKKTGYDKNWLRRAVGMRIKEDHEDVIDPHDEAERLEQEYNVRVIKPKKD